MCETKKRFKLEIKYEFPHRIDSEHIDTVNFLEKILFVRICLFKETQFSFWNQSSFSRDDGDALSYDTYHR